jgi:hypothetical protein
MKRWNHEECPICGCSLDFGERCTCLDEAEIKAEEIEKNLDRSEPQVRFKFDEMERKTA